MSITSLNFTILRFCHFDFAKWGISFVTVIYLLAFPLATKADSSFDSQRVSEVARVVSALESYAAQNSTYRVGNSGHNGNGQGWFHYVGGSYTNSISDTLVGLGLLASPLPKDPAHLAPGSYSNYDFLIYRCEDRIAVFSIADDIVPEAAHLDWWQSNACTQYPIDNLNHTYFALSEPLASPPPSFDSQRVSEVARVVSALESYAAQNSTYRVGNSGHNGNGQGWFHYVGGSYTNSISDTLVGLGLLASPLPKDPAHLAPGSYSNYDFLIYRCEDRIAVFSIADDIVPEAAHLDWWQSNACTQYPIDNLNHTYFALSEPLASPPPSFDSQRVSEVARVVSALESYAAQNSTYRVGNSGHNGNGQGWFHYVGGSYTNSISDTLVGLGLLASPLPKDPAHLAPEATVIMIS